MIINRGRTVIIVLLILVFIGLMDYIDISDYIDCTSHLDSTIANSITFISILIGFISSIYIMLQQNNESFILGLLRKKGLLKDFNNLFKTSMYVGFISVFILILMNFVASNFLILKVIAYIGMPLTAIFYISSIDIITTICKIILSEEKLKGKKIIVKEEDIKIAK